MMTTDSIIDTTKPNAGRIYDYFLGGHHNFEIDRQTADYMLNLLPSITKIVRLQRWCLQDIADELVNRGVEVIIDFASGLPTQDHIHEVVPEDIIVIYSDKDPITVEYAKEIVKDKPNVYTFEADAVHPEMLLESPDVKAILEGHRKIAFVLWGVVSYFTNDSINQATKYLYDWSDEEGLLVFQAQSAGMDVNNPKIQEILGIYKNMGSEFFLRSLEEYQQLVAPWKPDENGYLSLVEWHGIQDEVSQMERDIFSDSMVGYGAYLVKSKSV